MRAYYRFLQQLKTAYRDYEPHREGEDRPALSGRIGDGRSPATGRQETTPRLREAVASPGESGEGRA
jgi:hypothetical protein